MEVSIIKVDVAMECRGSFFMFNSNEDVDNLKSQIQDKYLPQYGYYPVAGDKKDDEDCLAAASAESAGYKPVSVSKGDNMRTSCAQFHIKRFLPGQSKSLSKHIKIKVYQKHVDVMQKEITGFTFGNNFAKLLAVGTKLDKAFVKNSVDCWDEGMTRVEFSHYFPRDFPYFSAIDLKEPSNNQKWISHLDEMTKAFVKQVLNHDSIATRMCHSHPVFDLLDGVARLSKNICVIDTDRVWLILSENGALKNSQQSYTAMHQKIVIGTGKVTHQNNALLLMLKRHASIGAFITLYS